MAIEEMKKIYVANKAGHKMGINEVDFDPSLHVLWDDHAAEVEEKTGQPVLDKAMVRDEIEAADNMGAIAVLVSKHGLKLPGNIKNFKTAKTKLLIQLED